MVRPGSPTADRTPSCASILQTEKVTAWKLPDDTGYTNLNTAVFDKDGIHWFTGQNGFYGRLDPRSGELKVWKAPRGRGPYGITATPEGDVYYASLAGNHIARIDKATGEATVIEPPTKGQGARRVWSDSKGRIWVSEWNAGQLGLYDPKANAWREWKLPGDKPQAYAVYVDEQRHRLGVRLGCRRHPVLRSGHRTVHELSDVRGRRQRTPDPRPARRGLVAGIGRGPADGDPHGPAVAVIRKPFPSAALLLGLAITGALADGGDPVRGEKVFQYCYSCHSMQPDEINLQGPNLHGIVGRKIASQEGFSYSPALRAFAQEEDRWSEALLDRYLTAPYKLVPKTSMAFPGIEAQDERADLIAYLRSKGEHL